jgi:hypothetical protein
MNSEPQPTVLHDREGARILPLTVTDVDVTIRMRFAGRHTPASATRAAENALMTGELGDALIISERAQTLVGPDARSDAELAERELINGARLPS